MSIITIETIKKENNRIEIRVNGEYVATALKVGSKYQVADPMACYRESKEFSSLMMVERYFMECQRAFENGVHGVSTRI